MSCPPYFYGGYEYIVLKFHVNIPCSYWNICINRNALKNFTVGDADANADPGGIRIALTILQILELKIVL